VPPYVGRFAAAPRRLGCPARPPAAACFESRTVYSYIQSRFYRSPEVGGAMGGAAPGTRLSTSCPSPSQLLVPPLALPSAPPSPPI
jgi:hypothetical protein